MYESRVISRREAVPQETQDWLKTVEDKYSVYPEISQYHRVYRFRENVFNIYEESADGMGDVWLQLIVGPERALLIDTGFGIGNLRALCDMLTGGKPLLVVNTHQGPDHAKGNCQFDRCYCHKYCYPAIKEHQCSPDMWDYLYDENKQGIWYRFNVADIIPYRQYELIPVENHTVFDLGEDHRVELIHTPGHAPGGASFLDKKNRLLFTGQFHTNYVGIMKSDLPYREKYGTVEAFRDSLIEMNARRDEYDAVVPAHEIIYLDNTFVADTLAVCQAVVENPDDYDFAMNENSEKEVRFKRIGQGSIRYKKDAVYY